MMLEAIVGPCATGCLVIDLTELVAFFRSLRIKLEKQHSTVALAEPLGKDLVGIIDKIIIFFLLRSVTMRKERRRLCLVSSSLHMPRNLKWTPLGRRILTTTQLIGCHFYSIEISKSIVLV